MSARARCSVPACSARSSACRDVVGKLKAEVRIDSNDKTVRVQLGKGIYLVNVNKTTRRISVAG